MASPGNVGGTSTGSRCTRADCTSLREELELLRGDLLELEGENEQLHDQLATLQSDASARELQTQQKLMDKEDEVVQLNETLAGLMTQLQQQLELHSEKTTTSVPDKPAAKPVEQGFEALKTQNEALETKLKELQAQLEREATAGLKAQRQVTQVAEESKDKRSELFTALKENELLRDEAAGLQEAVKKMTTQVKEYQVSIMVMQDQLEAYRDAVDEQTLEITQLHTKVEELEQEKLSVEAKLIEMDERESDVEALMSDAKAKFEMEKAVLIAELDELKRKLKQQRMLNEQQQQQVQESKKVVKDEEEEVTVRGIANAGLEDLERQLEMLQELRVRDKSTILELNQRILQQQSDLESLAEHLNVDAVVESAVEAAVQKQKAKLASLEQENATLKRRLKEQRELAQDLELRQGIVEKQLVEAEEWNAKYEQQAGLEDVVKYQKKLRAQLEQQRQLNVKLRQDLNEQVEAAGKLHVAFERLKAEVGKPATYEYDDLAIADHLKGQLAINGAVLKQMEIQIQELEAERLRFLKKLRDQARLTGHKLYEQHGLTTEQWSAVEEFIDRVKQTPEVAKRLLETNCELVGARGDDQSARREQEQQDVIDELERKLDVRCEENALLLKDIERLHNDGRGELLRALDAAKTKSHRQEGVIYHLRAEIASLRKEREQKDGKKDASPPSVTSETYDRTRDASHVATEARNDELEEQLHQHEEVFQSLMDQHTVLYQHFFQMHAQYANAEIRLRHELDQIAEENKDYKLKCERYEAGLHLLGVQNQESLTMTSDSLISGNEAQLRSEVIELTRKIAAYEVNEARLKRKYHQLHNEWQSSTEHNKLLQREWSEMERTLKYRVLYLETWKQGADEMIERMEKTLDKSVLREFADKQQRAMADVLKKYNALSESYAKMHAKYLEMYDLPAQLSRTQHNLMILQAEKSTKSGAGVAGCDPGILHDRITELESELQVQMEHAKELEEANRKGLLQADEIVQLINGGSGDDNELQNENRLLYERINEVEQLYESLALECAKYKDIASLAASQANTLTKRAAQEQGNREQQEEQLRELMASSEDHAIVGELQHQLMQIKATYQQFLVQYDLVTETQQQALLKNQRLELDMEKKAQELTVVREKSSDKVQILENAIGQVKERDWTARNTKWEAFRKRLDALEDEIQAEQKRRKQLEKDLEDKQAQLPLLDLKQQRGNQSEVGRLKSRVDALETRERLLMGQLEAASKATGSKEKEIRLQAELSETKTLNEDLMRQLEAIQARVSELLRLNGDLEAEKRELRCKYEDLELDLQYARTGSEGGGRRHDNQRDVDHGSSHSPLMRQKVGLYEKDQAELQQAAQVTIASLKQLVEEKNTLINEYQRKLAVVRASSAQDKAQGRLETTQLNKKLYEENQRMIGQLKEAMGTISSMERSGKSKQALQAAQERHDHRDAAKKEEKLKALRDAIIKLKEEFLKAEDRHAIEIVKAQHAMNQDLSARKRKEKERREEEEDEWREEKTRLQSQVQMLQEKLALLKKRQDHQTRRKKKVENEEKEEKDATSEVDVQVLKDEVERLKRLLKEKVVSEVRAVEELEKKIKILQAQNLALREASTHAPAAPTEVVDAKAKREQLESERKLQRRVDILMLRLKEKQTDKYEAQLQRLRRRLVQHGIPSTDDDVDDDTGPNSRLQREEQRFLVDQEVREELLALGDELRSKEQDMVAKDTKLLELELEVESLRLEYTRLQRKNQHGSDGLHASDDTSKQRRGAKGGAGGRGSSWATQERLELEEVIENMKKVIEKLRAENEKLKRAAAKQALISPERVEAMRRKLKEQKGVRERLEAQLEKLQLESGELKKDKLKLQQKLRAKAAFSSSKSESNALELQLKEKDRLLLQSEKELAELRHRVLQLELQVERDAHVEDDGQVQHEQEERIKELEAQVLELEDENTKLTNELAAFDEDFFEEIEDLKYKYTQAVRDKRQLEKRFARSADGISPASAPSRRSRS
ncbi:hypothetical protein JG687_00012798 [Phytophthora cactorum]|uniref:Uncharacterized protein n=1 Tax=Phytophthora cactorum TaxID=29920 RepID=A0A8T1U0T6_9STRA|nr:hypothetical protein JG687_00012798 [Phytophthora cactorum]